MRPPWTRHAGQVHSHDIPVHTTSPTIMKIAYTGQHKTLGAQLRNRRMQNAMAQVPSDRTYVQALAH